MAVTLTGSRSTPRLLAPLRALVRTALAGEGYRPGDVTIVLSDDPVLRTLNRRWRGIDRATDVLSFGYDDAPRPQGPLVHGDLVISMERMEEQAKRYRVTRGAELARLVIHGTLHLAGLDHHRLAERRVMRAAEAQALRTGRAAAKALDRLLAPGPRARRSR